ncbi:UNVERIFIED_ORG: DUF1799 domain-containing protein [Roseateles sp. XES5]|nr:DUF1799 domain-containing protein [Roseateles sp. XES5]
MQEQFQELGVSLAVSPDDEGTIAVMACNWPSLEAFLACATQWRTETVVMGGAGAISSQIVFVGLDYKSCLDLLKFRAAPPHVFDDMQVMEEAALPILNEVA